MDQKNVPPQGEQGAPVLPPLMTLQIIWVSLLLSAGMYVGLSFIIPFGGAGAMDTSVLELAFTVASLGLLAASFVLPRRMLASAVAQGAGTTDVAAIPLKELVAKAQAPWIVRLAMCEAVAIFGLILVCLSQRPMKVLPFGALAVLAMLAAFPSESALRRAAER